jgi:ATP-binding cassette subfamily C protein
MVVGVIKPVLQAMARGIVALFIIGFLFYIDPVLALIVTVVLGGAYGVLYLAVRQWLHRIGEAKVEANEERFSIANEAFGAVKDVKILGKEEVFTNRYRQPTQEYSSHRTWSGVISMAPKYLFEAVAFGGIILIAVYLLWAGGEMQEIIPILGMYTFAGYRLMPALQVMFRGVSKLRFNAPAVDKVHRDMTESRYTSAMRSNGETSKAGRLPLREQLSLEGVTFRYPDGEVALRDVSCTVEARTTVGIVGPSGAGKTTLVDLVLGLYLPQEGEIRVDGTSLGRDTVRAWQRTIGYVPQEINLADTSVARNIAYGEPEENIDMDAVRRAARSASIHEFVQKELSKGYDTVVGEEGMRLSGGQRQRIGIARALYRDPEMLIFDEATSSVDTATERHIMESIYKLSGEKTILVIAHRINTLEQCDKILKIEEGKLIGELNYREIGATQTSSSP